MTMKLRTGSWRLVRKETMRGLYRTLHLLIRRHLHRSRKLSHRRVANRNECRSLQPIKPMACLLCSFRMSEVEVDDQSRRRRCVDVSDREIGLERAETSSGQQPTELRKGPGRDAPDSQRQPNFEALFLGKFVSRSPSSFDILVHKPSSASAARIAFLLSTAVELNKTTRGYW
jgi:hypothetical protein